VIVVVGNPAHVIVEEGSVAGGLAAGVGRAAAAAGADVQLVGKVGEDPQGDAVLLDLARIGVGHVAVLRDPSRPTLEAPVSSASASEAELFADDPDDSEANTDPLHQPSAGGLTLDAGDIELALRYLPDYRVLVVADPLPVAPLGVVLAASGWSGATTVLLVPNGSDPPAVGSEATVLEAPADDSDGAFASVVGAYAAALDRGEEPAEAFATASKERGWSPVAD
jgi:ribokinase